MIQSPDVTDTLSTLVATTDAEQTIVFTTSTGVANGETITVTYPAGSFDLTDVDETDIDIEEGGVDEETEANCAGTDAVGISVAGQVITFDFCTGDGGSIAPAATVTVRIGLTATHDGTGADLIKNPAAGDYTIEIDGSMVDSGGLGVSIIADDSVNITSTVEEVLTFVIPDTTIGFGDLTAANARWATGDLVGADADSAAAHTMTVATNAADGWAITYNGATLTGSSGTIDVATITNDANGSFGTEQFAMGFSTNDDCSIETGYDHNATPADRDWKFVATGSNTIASELEATATETISAFYLANISNITEAGDYNTNVTYIATGVF